MLNNECKGFRDAFDRWTLHHQHACVRQRPKTTVGAPSTDIRQKARLSNQMARSTRDDMKPATLSGVSSLTHTWLPVHHCNTCQAPSTRDGSSGCQPARPRCGACQAGAPRALGPCLAGAPRSAFQPGKQPSRQLASQPTTMGAK